MELLKLLSTIEDAYEHKLRFRFGDAAIDQALADGFIQTTNSRTKITTSGTTELDRLESIPKPAPVLTAEQQMRKELVIKLQNQNITAAERDELLRIVIKY